MESVWCTERTRILQIILFIGVHFVVETTAQDCSFNAAPCRCSYGTLTCTNLEDLAALRKEVGDLNITRLSLYYGNTTSVPGNSLPPGLSSIYFYNQPLTTMSDDAFNNTAETLHTLTIIGANLRQLPKALLVLTNLTSLEIQDTPIQNWDDSILAHIITNIEYLTLKNVGLNAWPSSVSLSHVLTELDLSDNPLKSIPDEAFLFLTGTLLDLKLGRTSLTQFPTALSSLSNLISLDLSGSALSNVSDIEQLESALFAGNLIYLSLGSSQLKTILNFSSFTSLDGILLHNNSISDASVGSFPSSLTHLYLGKNRLSSVPTSIAHLPLLSELDLSYNKITSIEPGSLPPSLTKLDLEDNYITVITNTSFLNLANLTNLNLRYNPISIIETSALSDLVTLESLSLDFTSFKELPLGISSLPPSVDFEMYQTGEISCPCPTPQELLDWFKLRKAKTVLLLYCDTHQSVTQYLTTGCVATTTTVALTHTTHGGATTLTSLLFSSHGSVLLLVTVFLFFFVY